MRLLKWVLGSHAYISLLYLSLPYFYVWVVKYQIGNDVSM